MYVKCLILRLLIYKQKEDREEKIKMLIRVNEELQWKVVRTSNCLTDDIIYRRGARNVSCSVFIQNSLTCMRFTFSNAEETTTTLKCDSVPLGTLCM